tara:strand:+ start:23389 stop:24309 length:921 start_codon:yes stop_codon:yes gene_type:complete
MSKKKAVLLFNPQAGYGRKKNIFKKNISHQSHYESLLKMIKAELIAHNFELTTLILDKSINTTDIVAKLTPTKTDIVIAAGGDGTINKIINGLVISKLPLGIIPIGSVNILALDLNIALNIKQACQQIATGSPKKIDIGKANNHYFSSMAGIGLDAKIIKHTPLTLKKKFGLSSFAYIALKILSTYKYNPIHLSIDNKKTIHTAYSVIINNSKYYGGKFLISPKSSLTDGKLEIILLKKGNLRSLFQFLKHLIYGTLNTCNDITMIQGNTLNINNNEKHHLHVDAEYIGKETITISLLPKKLTIIC